MFMAKVLIVDDDQAVCTSLSLLLRRAGYEVKAIHHPRRLEIQLRDWRPDLVLLDMNFSITTTGQQGLKALQLIREWQPTLPVILMTGWATVALAVEGMKLGARDFIAKPWDNKRLLASVKTILALDGEGSTRTSSPGSDFDRIIGEDPRLRKVLDDARRISATDASVLILGESGTGKELLAEAIHYESHRRDKPFVKVNLGGISTSLFESELFGHKKGAFTDAYADRTGRFALADTGTIFLDEIGDLALPSQVKLLRVLQEQTFEVLGSSRQTRVDVRVISATNKPLPDMVAEGAFREDLFYRINLITLELPALRDRPGDIPLLVQHFVRQIGKNHGRTGMEIGESAVNWLQRQRLPGNIRQLKNILERSILMARDQEIRLSDLQAHYQDSDTQGDPLPQVGDLTLEEMEKKMIRKALRYHQNNISETARSLGLTRSALYRRLQKYQIPYDD